MQLGNPLLALHSALAAALHKDLPHITYQTRDWDAWRSLSKEEQADAIRNRSEPRKDCVRRPVDHDVEVVLFPQTWGSTARLWRHGRRCCYARLHCDCLQW